MAGPPESVILSPWSPDTSWLAETAPQRGGDLCPHDAVLAARRQVHRFLAGKADQDSMPCSRSFRYRFRSLIPRILAALPR
jgi:hypothetical protein